MTTERSIEAELKALLDNPPRPEEEDAVIARSLAAMRSEQSRTHFRKSSVLNRRPRSRRGALLVVATALVATVGGATAAGVDLIPGGDQKSPAPERMEVLRDDTVARLPSDETVHKMPSVLDDGSAPIAANDIQRRLEQMWSVEPDFMRKQYGENSAERARVLLDKEVGGSRVSMYATRSSNGVCYAVFAPGAPGNASCVDGFSRNQPIAYTYAATFGGPNSGKVLFGVAADEVVGVDLELKDGTPVTTTMGRNAWVWLGDADSPSDIDHFRIRLSSGTVLTVPARLPTWFTGGGPARPGM